MHNLPRTFSPFPLYAAVTHGLIDARAGDCHLSFKNILRLTERLTGSEKLRTFIRTGFRKSNISVAANKVVLRQ